MNNNLVLSMLALVGLTCCGLAYSQTAGGEGEPSARPTTLTERQQRDINRLEREIADRQQKLDKLQHASKHYINSDVYRIPRIQSKKALVSNTGSTYAIVLLGRKDGILSTDRWVVVRRARGANTAGMGADRLEVVGYCMIVQLYDKDMQLVAQSDTGIRPEDEVYIINRENSPYSFAFARLW